jgi:hypothetical protein
MFMRFLEKILLFAFVYCSLSGVERNNFWLAKQSRKLAASFSLDIA